MRTDPAALTAAEAEPTANIDWARAIVLHLTGRADEPTPMLLQMIEDIRADALKPPVDALKGAKPLVLFFRSDADRMAFVEVVREARPTMAAIVTP